MPSSPAPLRASALAFALLAATLGARPAAAQPYHSARCPVPAGVEGYPVAVRAAEGTWLDEGFAAALADAAARRWEMPAPGRGRLPGTDRPLQRLRTPEPLWPDDWTPQARHTARLAVTLYRDSRPASVAVVRPSGDRAFDRSLPGIFRASPAEPALPPYPADAPGDSLPLVVALGEPPSPDDRATVRFAAQQSPVRVLPGSLRVVWPTGTRAGPLPGAVARYDVDAAGRIVPGSVRILAATEPAFGRAVQEALMTARFTPAQADCRPVARSVVQAFGRV